MSEYQICASCRCAIQPGSRTTDHNGETKHAECGKRDRQRNSRAHEIKKALATKRVRTPVAPKPPLDDGRSPVDDILDQIGRMPAENLNRIEGFQLSSAQMDQLRHYSAVKSQELGVHRLTIYGRELRRLKKAELLAFTATADELGLRRIVAALIREVFK